MPAKDLPTLSNCAESWRVFRIMSEFVEGFEALAEVGKAVTIFGSARTKPDDPYYKSAERTAQLLAKAGFAVITGGGPGIMEAANKGAIEAGAPSAGLNITLPHEQEANKYQTVSLDFHYFYARKVMFLKYAAALVCFPGGYGTLDEFFECITLIQTLKAKAVPVVLFGSEYWGGLADWLNRTLKPHFIDAEDLEIFRVTDDPRDVVRWVKGKSWWRPSDAKLAAICDHCEKGNGPLSGAHATHTGEGTRYGKRPMRTDKRHAQATAKPQQ
jgi:hypothetical protein